MYTEKLLKIARFLFIAEKISDIANNVKLDLIAFEYGKNLKKGKLEQFQSVLKSKYPEKFDKYNSLVINTLSKINSTVNSYLGKNTPQMLWFYHRYLLENKHIQDIVNLQGEVNQNGSLVKMLQYLQKYQAYDKSTKKQLRDGLINGAGVVIVPPKFDISINGRVEYDFNALTNLMEEKEQKNKIKKEEFNFPAPKTIPEIKIPGISNYKVYKAFGSNKKHFRELHDIDGLGPKKITSDPYEEYQEYYARWCVVTGSRPWGEYLNSGYNYYYYVTKADNTPYVLMNFGYNSDAQIKNIRDFPFTNYDEQFFLLLDYLAKKDDFNLKESDNDYKSYIKIKEVYYNELDTNELEKETSIGNLIVYSKKADEREYSKTYYIYDNNNNPAYLLQENNVFKIKNQYSLTNIDLIKILIYLKKYGILKNLINKQIISKQNTEALNLIIDFYIENNTDQLTNFLCNGKIQFNQDILNKFISKQLYAQLYALIQNNIITDSKTIEDIVKLLLNDTQLSHSFELIQMLNNHKISMNFYKTIIKYVKNHDSSGQYCLNILSKKLYTNQNKQSLIQHIIKVNSNVSKIQEFLTYIDNDYLANLQFKRLISIETKTNEIKSMIVKLLNEFTIQYEYIAKFIYQQKSNTNVNNILEQITNENVLEKFYEVAKEKRFLNILSYFVSVGKIVEKQKNNIIQQLISKRKYQELLHLIIRGKINDPMKNEQIIQMFMRLKNNKYYLGSVLVNINEIQLLQKDAMAKTIMKKLAKNISALQMSNLFVQGAVPVDMGHLYINDVIEKAQLYSLIDIPKKYLTNKFIETIAQNKDYYFLRLSLRDDALTATQFKLILSIIWNKLNEEDKINKAKNIEDLHKKYRMTFGKYCIINDFEFTIKHPTLIQDDLHKEIVNILINNNDTNKIIQFLKNLHHPHTILTFSNKIYDKIKNQADPIILIDFFDNLNQQNKKQFINKMIESKNIGIITRLVYNLRFDNEITNYFVNLLPIDIITKIDTAQFFYQQNKCKELIKERALQQLNDIESLTQFLNNNYWTYSNDFFNKLLDLINNAEDLKKSTSIINKKSYFITTLLNNNFNKIIKLLPDVFTAKQLKEILNTPFIDRNLVQLIKIHIINNINIQYYKDLYEEIKQDSRLNSYFKF